MFVNDNLQLKPISFQRMFPGLFQFKDTVLFE